MRDSRRKPCDLTLVSEFHPLFRSPADYLCPTPEWIIAGTSKLPEQDEIFLALALFDCWSRREHKMTARLMAQPPKVRDAVFEQIVAEFKKEKPPEKQGWFDHLITRLVEEELDKNKGNNILDAT